MNQLNRKSSQSNSKMSKNAVTFEQELEPQSNDDLELKYQPTNPDIVRTANPELYAKQIKILNQSTKSRRKNYKLKYVSLKKLKSWSTTGRGKKPPLFTGNTSNSKKSLSNDQEYPPSPSTNTIMCVHEDDMRALEVDACVLTMSPSGFGVSGISKKFFELAGPSLQEEIMTVQGSARQLADLHKPGFIVATCGYHLPARYLYHVRIPSVFNAESLKEAYTNCLNRCKEQGLKSVAFPCLGTGGFTYPRENACKIALKVIREWLDNNGNVLDNIVLSIMIDKDQTVYNRWMPFYFPVGNQPAELVELTTTDFQLIIQPSNTMLYDFSLISNTENVLKNATTIDLSNSPDICTDYLFYKLHQHKSNNKVTSINCSGAKHLTSTGVDFIVRTFGRLDNLDLDKCTSVDSDCLTSLIIEKEGLAMKNISLSQTSISLATEDQWKVLNSKDVSILGCPLEQQKSEMKNWTLRKKHTIVKTSSECQKLSITTKGSLTTITSPIDFVLQFLSPGIPVQISKTELKSTVNLIVEALTISSYYGPFLVTNVESFKKSLRQFMSTNQSILDTSHGLRTAIESRGFDRLVMIMHKLQRLDEIVLSKGASETDLTSALYPALYMLPSAILKHAKHSDNMVCFNSTSTNRTIATVMRATGQAIRADVNTELHIVGEANIQMYVSVVNSILTLSSNAEQNQRRNFPFVTECSSITVGEMVTQITDALEEQEFTLSTLTQKDMLITCLTKHSASIHITTPWINDITPTSVLVLCDSLPVTVPPSFDSHWPSKLPEGERKLVMKYTLSHSHNRVIRSVQQQLCRLGIVQVLWKNGVLVNRGAVDLMVKLHEDDDNTIKIGVRGKCDDNDAEPDTQRALKNTKAHLEDSMRFLRTVMDTACFKNRTTLTEALALCHGGCSTEPAHLMALSTIYTVDPLVSIPCEYMTDSSNGSLQHHADLGLDSYFSLLPCQHTILTSQNEYHRCYMCHADNCTFTAFCAICRVCVDCINVVNIMARTVDSANRTSIIDVLQITDDANSSTNANSELSCRNCLAPFQNSITKMEHEEECGTIISSYHTDGITNSIDISSLVSIPLYCITDCITILTQNDSTIDIRLLYRQDGGTHMTEYITISEPTSIVCKIVFKNRTYVAQVTNGNTGAVLIELHRPLPEWHDFNDYTNDESIGNVNKLQPAVIATSHDKYDHCQFEICIRRPAATSPLIWSSTKSKNVTITELTTNMWLERLTSENDMVMARCDVNSTDWARLFPIGYANQTSATLLQPSSADFKNLEIDHNWNELLTETLGIPCPFELFNLANVESMTRVDVGDGIAQVARWTIGMKLEAVDITNPTVIHVATVINVKSNDQVTIGFDGPSESYESDTSSVNLHPIGYCASQNMTLQPPEGYGRTFKWIEFLKETNSVAVPHELFTKKQTGGCRPVQTPASAANSSKTDSLPINVDIKDGVPPRVIAFGMPPYTPTPFLYGSNGLVAVNLTFDDDFVVVRAPGAALMENYADDCGTKNALMLWPRNVNNCTRTSLQNWTRPGHWVISTVDDLHSTQQTRCSVENVYRVLYSTMAGVDIPVRANTTASLMKSPLWPVTSHVAKTCINLENINVAGSDGNSVDSILTNELSVSIGLTSARFLRSKVPGMVQSQCDLLNNGRASDYETSENMCRIAYVLAHTMALMNHHEHHPSSSKSTSKRRRKSIKKEKSIKTAPKSFPNKSPEASTFYTKLNMWLSMIQEGRLTSDKVTKLNVDWPSTKQANLIDDNRLACVQQMFMGDNQWMADEKLNDEELANIDGAEQDRKRQALFERCVAQYLHMPVFRPHLGGKLLHGYVLRVLPRFTQLTVLDLHHCSVLTEDVHSKLGECVGVWRNTLTLLNLSGHRICLNDEWPTWIFSCTNMTKLYLEKCGIQHVDKRLGRLVKLESLSFSYNMITSKSANTSEWMPKLTQLSRLTWAAIPLMFMDDEEMITLDTVMAYFREYNVKLGEQEPEDVQKQLRELLQTTKLEWPLDDEKIAEFNEHVIEKLCPRLDKIPDECYDCKNMTVLNFDDQDIQDIPNKIGNLRLLSKLSVENCPQLENVSNEIGGMQLMKEVSLRGCGFLNTPPPEVVGKGSRAILAYMRRLLSGERTCWRTKLMFVGLGGAGKTSLVNVLRKSHSANDTVITDGIDIAEMNMKATTKAGKTVDITYTMWDFAGQSVYYNTHQFFLSNKAVYLLLWNARLGYEHGGLDFWLSSIACHAPRAPIFIVGTHSDQVFRADVPQKQLLATYPQIAHFCNVSSETMDGIDDFTAKLIETTMSLEHMGMRVPSIFLTLEQYVMSRRSEMVISYASVYEKATTLGLFDHVEVREALDFLYELGSLQYFSSELLHDRVVVDAQWLVDVMSCLVSVNKSVIREGRFKRADIAVIWKDYDKSIHEWLLRLTEEFDLSYQLQSSDINIVPCLLPEQEPDINWPEITSTDVREIKLIYRFDYLPAGLFNRAQTRLSQYSDASTVWKKGSILKKNNHLALFTVSRDDMLVLTVQGPRPENVLYMVVHTLILELFEGVVYDLLVPCVDCVRAFAQDPHMFSAKQVKRAQQLNAPFLQCSKSFHIVGLGALNQMVPPTTGEDFSEHLQTMLHELDQLSVATSINVMILCSQSDVNSSIATQPTYHKILVELNEQEIIYETFALTSSNDHDLGAKLCNCKCVLIYCTNELCDLPNSGKIVAYIGDKTYKPVVTVIGNNIAPTWRTTGIGMLLTQDIYIDMKTDERCADKMPILMARLKGMMKRDVKSAKTDRKSGDVFVSYCWSNSKLAGRYASADVKGDADPRYIATWLNNAGISTWLDVVDAAEGALFEEISSGLRACKVVLAFVSDEYKASTNCMREFHFAADNLKRPLILCPVGKTAEWQSSLIALLALSAPRIDPTNREALMTEIKKYLIDTPEPEPPAPSPATVTPARKRLSIKRSRSRSSLKSGVKIKKSRSKSAPRKNSKTATMQDMSAYGELMELAQRKFVQHVTQAAQKRRGDINQLVPRLVFIDVTDDCVVRMADKMDIMLVDLDVLSDLCIKLVQGILNK